MAKYIATIIAFSACTIFLFMVSKPQIKELINSRNGGYSEWTAWTRCTKSCDTGQKGKNESRIFYTCYYISITFLFGFFP